MNMRIVIGLIAALALAGCAATTQPSGPLASTPPAAPASAFDKAWTVERLVIAGQPTAADIASLGEHGIMRVINLRTPAEMSDRAIVPFDQAAMLASAGIAYEEIPIGGTEHPFRPEALEAFRVALESTDGPVLLHCASGARASTLYAAYRVKYRDVSPDEAMRDLERFGTWPLPLEKLTGIPLRIERR